MFFIDPFFKKNKLQQAFFNNNWPENFNFVRIIVLFSWILFHI